MTPPPWWCIDVRCIDARCERVGGDELRWLLRQLTNAARGHGLVPATIDRLS